MRPAIAALRSGAWLTPERLKIYPALTLAVVAAAILGLLVTSDGLRDAGGRPLGTDFSQVWVAGREIAAGQIAAVFDTRLHVAAQEAFFGVSDTFYTWPYPPYFLFVAAASGVLPYLAALLAWQGATLALYLGAIRALVAGTALPRGATLIAAAALPAVAINLMHGHNGFLTAALLAWGTVLLPRRPLLAGLVFALLAYKPQFALALPVALVAGGAWRCLVGAVLGLSAFTATTLAAFGTAPWRGFFVGATFTQKVVLEEGAIGYEKIQTIFAAVRLFGGGVPLAYAVQGALSAAALASLAWIWRTCREPTLRGAALMTATLLTTPYALDYDEVVLGPALVLMAVYGTRCGFPPFAQTTMAFAWALPLGARALGGLGLPIGPLGPILLYLVILAAAVRSSAAARDGRPLTEVNKIRLA